MRSLYLSVLTTIVAPLLSCGDSGVTPREDPTDEDAIYNSIRYDLPSLFNTDLLDFSVPDTAGLGASNFLIQHFWHHLDSTTYFIAIDITDPTPGDPVGTVPVADVTVSKNFYGTYEIIGIDTTGGGSAPLRLSHHFNILGVIYSRFEKLGFNSDARRGWVLTRISDAVYSEPQSFDFRGTITVRSISYPHEYTEELGAKRISDLLSFEPGESLTVVATFNQTPDIVTLRYPSSGGRATLTMQNDGTGRFFTGFRLPNSVRYDHFLVSSSYANLGPDSVNAITEAAGILYRAR